MKRKVQFDKRLFAKEPTYKLPAQEENSFEQLRTFSQWLLVVPFTMVVLFAAGQLAIFGDIGIAFADAPSNLSAEYSPWSFIPVHPVLATIVEEIRRDFEKVADPRQTFSDPIEEQGFAFIEKETTILVAELPSSRNPNPTQASAPGGSGEVQSPEPSAEPSSSSIPVPTPTQMLIQSETPLPSSPSPTSSSATESTSTPIPQVDEPATTVPTAATEASPTAVQSSTPLPTFTALPTSTAVPTATEVVDDPVGWWNSCFDYRQPIVVNTANAAVENGYTVSYTFNHQSLVSAGKSRSDGRDIRIARVTGSNWTQLNRVIDDDSAWNRSNSRVLFKLQSGIAAQSEDTSYYMYYGCLSDGDVPKDRTKVYWYYNDFNERSDLNGWTQRFVDDQGEWDIVSSTLGNRSGRQSSDTPYINDKLVLTMRPTIRDLHVEFDFMAMDNDLIAVGLCSNDTSPNGFYMGISQDWWFDDSSGPDQIGFWKNPSSNGSSGKSYSEDRWYEVTHAWTANNINSTFAGSSFQWNAGPSSANYFCFATNGMSRVHFDNLMIRLYVTPEPVLTLDAEQSLP